MKFDKQSNIYTVIYIVVLVTVVGAALAYTSMSLKERQNENIASDKKRQILASLHITADKDSISDAFSRYITSEFIVNSRGERLEGDAFEVDVQTEQKLPAEERQLPVYEATTTYGTKYVVPVYGAGLWGPIWGYVAVDSDGSTIYGAYFAHQGETPGLGAEIAKPAFSSQFIDKQLFKDGRFVAVEVVKKGSKPSVAGADYVDGVSGGTITSKGVGSMLDNCLSPYATFFSQLNSEKH